MQLRTSKDKKDADRILPLRVGDGEVAGILFNTICPDVRQRPAEHTAELIVNRLRLIVPDAEPPSSSPPRFVYLAECTPDMEGPQNRMRAFLSDLGWSVLPSEPYPSSEFQARLEADLRQCLAFVQLLGPHPSETRRLRSNPKRASHHASGRSVSVSQFGHQSREDREHAPGISHSLGRHRLRFRRLQGTLGKEIGRACTKA